MDPRSNLDTLMARYQAGDSAAVTALVEGVSPQLHRFFMAQSANRSDADDLLQETWLRIHRVRHTYRPGEPVLPWFYAIARRVRIDHYRRASRSTARERLAWRMSEMPGHACAVMTLTRWMIWKRFWHRFRTASVRSFGCSR